MAAGAYDEIGGKSETRAIERVVLAPPPGKTGHQFADDEKCGGGSAGKVYPGDARHRFLRFGSQRNNRRSLRGLPGHTRVRSDELVSALPQKARGKRLAAAIFPQGAQGGEFLPQARLDHIERHPSLLTLANIEPPCQREICETVASAL